MAHLTIICRTIFVLRILQWLSIARASYGDYEHKTYFTKNEPYLIIGTASGIYSLQLKTNTLKELIPSVNAASLDFAEDHEILYWIDSKTGKIHRKPFYFGTEKPPFDTVIESSKNWRPAYIAVGTISNGVLLFVLDSSGRKIDKYDVNGIKVKSGLIENIAEPSGLAIDGRKGFLFYGDGGKVYRSNLNGENKILLGIKSPTSPIGISRLDETACYSDENNEFIKCSKYNNDNNSWTSGHPSKSLKGIRPQVVTMTALNGTIYWVDKNQKDYPGIVSVDCDGENFQNVYSNIKDIQDIKLIMV